MSTERWRLTAHARGLAALGIMLALGLSFAVASNWGRKAEKVADASDAAAQPRRNTSVFFLNPKQLEGLTIEPARAHVFRNERLTEGKIAVDEDRATLVYSPYSGRVTRLFAKPGELVAAGQPLFSVESPDMIQAQNDFVTAIAGMNKAQSSFDLAKIVEQQNTKLYETRAASLRDLQQSQASTLAAKNDVHAAQISLEAVRNRLRILGKTDEEITKFGETGAISPQTVIYTPIAGTVVQRKVGPGQYVNTAANSPAANDATFIISDLSTVWLVGFVRETDAPSVQVGQTMRFTVLAYPDRTFDAKINYVAASLDPATRRLTVRATIDNPEGKLRPEMFASVTLLTGEDGDSVAIPRDAILYDGSAARVWVLRDDKSVELRKIKTGLSDGPLVQVTKGLQPGERVVVKGSLFIDRAAGT